MKKQLISFVLMITMIASISFKGAALNVDAKKVSVNKKKVTMTVGQKKIFKVNTKEKVKWKSSNKKIVTVNKKGVVKAKKSGKAKITASFSSKKIQYIIKVNKKKVTQVTPTEVPATVAPATEAPAATNVPVPTTEPAATEAPTQAPEATEAPEEPNNTLSFDIDQKPISSKTKVISGNLALPEYESVLTITVNGNFIAQIDLKNGETTYSVDVDLSSYSVGAQITLSREYTGENNSENEILNFKKTMSMY